MKNIIFSKRTSAMVFLAFFLAAFSSHANVESPENNFETNSIDIPIVMDSNDESYDSNMTAAALQNVSNRIIFRLYRTDYLEEGRNEHDSFGIFFSPDYDNALTSRDARKPFNFAENLGINHNETILSIEYREMPLTGEEFQLYSYGYTYTEYTLQMVVINLEGYDFYLEDAYTGTSTWFGTGEDFYDYVVDDSDPASISKDRFKIRVGGPEQHYVYEDGEWTPGDPSGVSTETDNILVKNGTTSLTADTNANDVTILYYSTLEVDNVLNVHGNLNNTGDLVFTSSAQSDGELGVISGNILKTVEVQRYMSHNRAYRMVSSSVSTETSIRSNWQEGANNPDPTTNHNPNPGYGIHITGSTTGANGFDATQSGNASMYEVDVLSQMFTAVTNTDTDTLTVGKPYLLFVRGHRGVDLNSNTSSDTTVMRAKGWLHKGPHSQDFEVSANHDQNFVMFGNPYQSTVDVSSVFENSTNVITSHYYIYDPTLAVQGAYVTVSLEGMGIPNTSDSDANKYLQPGQAAQIMTMGPGAVSINFNESDKAPGNHTTTNVNGTSIENMLIVQLFTLDNYRDEGPMHDSFGIMFDDSFDNALTTRDAIKPFNFYENLGINHDGKYLSLEYREMPQANEVFQVYTSGYTDTNYVLRMKIDGLEGVALYLDDHYTGLSTLIDRGEAIYRFAVNSEPLSKADDRFTIRVEERLGINDNNLLSGISLYPNPVNNETFHISAPQLDGQQVNLSISDMSGRQIYENDLDCIASRISVTMDQTLASGIYLVTLRYAGQDHTLRLVKE